MATLTIQTTAALTADNYLTHGSATANNGSGTLIKVGDNPNDERRGILKFDFSALPTGSIISAAVLSLYYYDNTDGDPVGRTYWSYRVIQRDWTELGSSWNYYVGSTAWTAGGGDYTTTDGASVAVPAAVGWMAFDVLTQVQFAQSYTEKVAHLLIKDGTEDSDKKANFYSNNYVTDTTKCPKLVITYTVVGWNHIKNGVAVTSNSKVNGVDTVTAITSVDGVI